MSDWDDGYGFFDYAYPEYENEKKELTKKQNKCYHEYYPIQLIFSTVWNCKHCNAKKEEITDE